MGYKLAGYDVVGNCEIDRKICEMYKKNLHPRYSYNMDIRDFLLLPENELPEDLFQLDILDGSPPCSVFSMSGKREKDWGRSKRFREGQERQTLDDLLEGLFTKEAVKLKSVERELKEFCRKTNRYVESSRGGAIGYTRSTAQKVVWANKKYTKTFGFDIIKNNRYLKNYARLDVPDTIEKALAGTNPGYATGSIEYMLNCQRCVAAYDMRRRGLKVEAKPNISEYDALTDNYTLPWKGSIMVGCPSGSGLDKIKSEMKAYGDGARAVVRVEWADEKYGNAHVFIAEQIGGKTVFLDPQSGERDVSYYFNSVRSGTTTFIRIDNLDVTSYIKDCCKKVEKND